MHRLSFMLLAMMMACKAQAPGYFGTIKPQHSTDMLVINNGSEPEWIDPGKCSDATGGEIISNIFAGLVESDPQTHLPIPDIAERWEVSADGKLYTFYLRKALWSDGTPLTAHDFEWSFKRVLNPQTHSKYASIMFDFVNAKAFNQGEVGEDAVGVKALEDYVLEIRLQNPVPYFLSLMSFYTFMPVPKHLLEKLKAQNLNTDLWTRPEYIVSNGAYNLTEWKFRQYLMLEKNSHYWNAKIVQTTKIKLLEVESYNTALNLYRTGELDWIGSNTSLPSEFISHLSTFKDFRQDPHLAVYFYWLNTKKPPLDNVKVRQALSMAIDRESLVKYVTKSGQIPTADLVPDGLAGYQGLKTPLYQPEKARQLLAEAGYKDGANFPEVTLIYNTSEGHKQIAEAVQQMWKKVLNVTINIENREWKVFLSDLALGNFHMARMGWVGDYADPNTFLHDVLASYAGNNHSGWQDKNYDALLQQANAVSDVKTRMQMLQKVERIAMDAQPLIPFYVYTHSTVVKPYIQGYYSDYQDKHPFKYLFIDKRYN